MSTNNLHTTSSEAAPAGTGSTAFQEQGAQFAALRHDLKTTRICTVICSVLVLCLLIGGALFSVKAFGLVTEIMDQVLPQLTQLADSAEQLSAITEQLKDLDVEALNKALADLDTEALSKTLNSLNQAVESLENFKGNAEDFFDNFKLFP